MTFQKYLHPLEIREVCKNGQCQKPIYDLKRASFKESNILFCSSRCRNNFYKYEYDIRKLHNRFLNHETVTERSLKGLRSSWRIILVNKDAQRSRS